MKYIPSKIVKLQDVTNVLVLVRALCELAGRREAGEVRPGQNSGGRGAWPLCIVLLGAGWRRLVPASAPAPTLSGLAIVPPMAGLRAPSPAPPRTAPHTTAAAALSPVTGGSLLYTLHTTHSHPGLYRPYSPSCGDQAHLNPAPDPL